MVSSHRNNETAIIGPEMSKLSPALKKCISAPFARPGTIPAPAQIRSVYEKIGREAVSERVGLTSWLTISTAATMTMNSPESLVELYRLVSVPLSYMISTDSPSNNSKRDVWAAELMREVGLKCISFNGIPRTINCLGAFRASLPEDVTKALSISKIRDPTASNINEIKSRAEALWQSIYAPHEMKLYHKLAESHPDLPIHILYSHYGPLLADFPEHAPGAKVGRVLTSIVAIACLRAQTGVGPQVTSHIFGLRKAYEDGSHKAEGENKVEGGEWLASDAGSIWILESVDAIVNAIGSGTGTTFAPGIQPKL